MANNLDTVCRFAWDYPVVNISRNELRNCCRAKPATVTEPILKELGTRLFAELEPLVQVKKALLMGQRPDECQSCWKIEASGAKSPRTGAPFFIELLKETKWFGTEDVAEIRERLVNITEDEADKLARYLDHPRMLEVSLSNTCDLKCMYCSHHYSSQWAAERLKYKEIPIAKMATEFPVPSQLFMDTFWKYFDTVAFKKCEIVNFIGGEPLIIDEFYEYLDRVLTKYETHPNQDELPPLVFIGVVTNLNCKEKYFKKLCDVIPRILKNPRLHLDLNVSLEAVGARTEFIRTGTNWERLDSNIKRLLALLNAFPIEQKRNVHFGFQIALNSLCISDLPNFFRYVVGLRKSVDMPIRLRPNQVVYPSWLSPHVLPVEYANYIELAIAVLRHANVEDSTVHRFDSWSTYIKFLRGVQLGIRKAHKHDPTRQSFMHELTKLVERRKLDFRSTFPEMVPFYEQIQREFSDDPSSKSRAQQS
jgi:hypothetical protein